MNSFAPVFAPVVVLIVDDPAVGRVLRRHFNNNSAFLAPLVFPNLRGVREILQDTDLVIDAVVSDLSFEPGTDDPDHEINDGLDLLNMIQQQRPGISKYVLSMWSNEKAFHDRSKELDLNIRHWFPKLNFRDPMNEPWTQIERDLLRDNLMNGGTLSEEASRQGWEPNDESSFEKVLEWFRARHNPMKFSFIQELPRDFGHYRIIKPIQVVCREQEGKAIADGLHLGLLNSGQGDTVEEAVKDLAEVMMQLKETLDEYSPEDIIDYAAVVNKRLDQHIQRIPSEQLS